MPVRVVIVTSDFHNSNLGDLAMLQVTVERLRERWPDAQIHILNQNPAGMAEAIPGVESAWPIKGWYGDGFLLGRFKKLASESAVQRMGDAKRAVRRVFPWAEALAIDLKTRFRNGHHSRYRAFWRVIKECDLLLLCGAGGIGDLFEGYSMLALNVLDLAIGLGRRTAVLGHGFASLEPSGRLYAHAQKTLRNVDLISLREKINGPRLVASWGIRPDRVAITGDDAIELAYTNRRLDAASEGLGINLRIQPISGVDRDDMERVRTELKVFARHHKTRLIPLPISRNKDPQTIRDLIAPLGDAGSEPFDLESPLQVIEQAGRCRVVVTGAYHAAVFALSQGIPAVCLAKSNYFADKFQGLKDLFGAGCRVVHLARGGMEKQLVNAMEELWAGAHSLRHGLLAAAQLQVEASREAHGRAHALVRA